MDLPSERPLAFWFSFGSAAWACGATVVTSFGPSLMALAELEAAVDHAPEWQTAENAEARQMIFLVTFSSVLAETAQHAPTPLRTLDGLSRHDVLQATLDAIANPMVANPRGGRPRTVSVAVVKAVVFLEEPRHFHVALRLSSKCRFLPFKLALRHRSGLASHWSKSHTQWWSVVRYGVFATARKPKVDPSPLAWTSTGEPLALYEESQEPFNAHAFKGKREAAELRVAAVEAAQAAESPVSDKPAKFGKLDFTALAIANDLKTPAAVLSYAQAKGSLQLQNYVCRNQGKLPELLAHASSWQGAEAALLNRLSPGRIRQPWKYSSRPGQQTEVR